MKEVNQPSGVIQAEYRGTCYILNDSTIHKRNYQANKVDKCSFDHYLDFPTYMCWLFAYYQVSAQHAT